MASTRKMESITIRMNDDGQTVAHVEVIGSLQTTDIDNPSLDYKVQESILVLWNDMLSGEQTSVQNFANNVRSAVVARIRPIT